MTDEQVRKVLGSVLLTGDDVFKQVGVLSGGERVKLCFAILTLIRGNVLILDEPTNHLDLITKEVLEQALIEYEGTIILVSHDRYLLNKLSTRIIEVTESGVKSYKGTYDDYLKQKSSEIYQKEKSSSPQTEKPKQDHRNKQYRTKQQRAADVKRKQLIKELEAEIELLEKSISQLEAEISTPELAGDYELCADKCRELEEKKRLLDNRLEEWAELE